MYTEGYMYKYMYITGAKKHFHLFNYDVLQKSARVYVEINSIYQNEPAMLETIVYSTSTSVRFNEVRLRFPAVLML